MSDNPHALLPVIADLQGRVVDDRFPLEKFLDSAQAAVRGAKQKRNSADLAAAGESVVREFPENTYRYSRFATRVSGKPAILEIHSQDADQVATWLKVQTLENPDLLKILAVGSANWPDYSFSYLVTEPPSETVADVLQQRPFDPNEAKEILLCILRALDTLHTNGLVHCAVDINNVVATDDAVKLSVSSIRPGGDECTDASDILAAGATVFQALTQRLPSENYFFEVSTLPISFSSILLRCLEKDPRQQWTAGMMLRLLNQSQAQSAAPATEVEPAPKIAPAAGEKASLAVPAPPVISTNAQDFRVAEPEPEYDVHDPLEGPKKQRGFLKFVIPAIALLVVILIFALRRDTGQKTPPSEAPAPATSAQTVPSSPAIEQPAATPPPKAAATPPPAKTSDSGNWRVIAFTYNSEQAAQHKADFVNHQDQAMNAQVFSPQPGRFLVALGGWMSRDEAMQLRLRVRAHGMPGDTYAQNFHR